MTKIEARLRCWSNDVKNLTLTCVSACKFADASQSRTTMERCRLCHGPTTELFNLQVLGRYDVRYFECKSCGSAQTEVPYWLKDAYAIPGVHVDVGQAARVVATWLRLNSMLEQIGFDKDLVGVDYGGAAGLLTRLMRDSGYNFYAYDTYDDSKYANYFRIATFTQCKPAIVTAFEVFEHFPDPRTSLLEIFDSGADLVIFSAVFYEQQGPEWPYLIPFCGQHVFFYSQRGLESFASEHGFDMRRVHDFWVLVRRGTRYETEIYEGSIKHIDAKFAGDHVQMVGWATSATVRDFDYAKARFERELPLYVKKRGWFDWLSRKR
ncbi:MULTISPECIES: class I SAM-dependent methyltransferase [Methylobacterium]|nr:MULTISPECIES: class I SAM-dependent methyltransferase [Methylobacterium]